MRNFQHDSSNSQIAQMKSVEGRFPREAMYKTRQKSTNTTKGFHIDLITFKSFLSKEMVLPSITDARIPVASKISKLWTNGRHYVRR